MDESDDHVPRPTGLPATGLSVTPGVFIGGRPEVLEPLVVGLHRYGRSGLPVTPLDSPESLTGAMSALIAAAELADADTVLVLSTNRLLAHDDGAVVGGLRRLPRLRVLVGHGAQPRCGPLLTEGCPAVAMPLRVQRLVGQLDMLLVRDHEAVITTDPALLVRSSDLTNLLHGLVGTATEPAAEHGAGPTGEPAEPGIGELGHTVLLALAKGGIDEVAAQRLGMSVRSYRRQVALVMAKLGARSRFEAGMLAERRGLI
ncbi:hypothetical protein F0L68_12370 [Solihabitans fulvus]|uniref:HTH luxR-type domain-containing protein n=1 Tax=Solihabitans fulvus TaxID=1892852 RepID=A0A5B2XHN2_9PSEU|nr:hypothetical protein [Solihabitans fulvus]KAA2262684.1 hypothetical protein F0L68_12370 [Solihabitans fulvus]